jgi:hypothetical protein
VPESDRLGIGDLFVRPFVVLAPTMRDVALPGVWRRPALLAFGIVAEVVGLAVVGGIPWDRVWELGPAEPPKRKLVQSIENIGKETDDESTTAPAGNILSAKRRADCVIIGYTPTLASRIVGGSPDDPDFSSLILASDIRGKLTFVGVVSGGIPDADRQAIRTRLRELARNRAIIPAGVSANWLEPVLACRVTYARTTSDNRFEGIEYDKLLAEISR